MALTTVIFTLKIVARWIDLNLLVFLMLVRHAPLRGTQPSTCRREGSHHRALRAWGDEKPR
jgi:hypothetical protein